jgi:hypothetical protein
MESDMRLRALRVFTYLASVNLAAAIVLAIAIAVTIAVAVAGGSAAHLSKNDAEDMSIDLPEAIN